MQSPNLVCSHRIYLLLDQPNVTHMKEQSCIWRIAIVTANQKKSFKLSNLNGAAILQDMYAHIDDYDALNGTLKMFSTNNLNEKLTTFQYSDSWSLAHESFEALGSTKNSVSNNTKLLQSLNEHGLYNEVLSTLSARTDSNDLKSIPLDWSLMGLHAAVYKGDSKQLENGYR